MRTSAVLQQVTDLQAVVAQINGAFAPETAQGTQLDVVGASLGLSRAGTSVGVTASDLVFRDFIMKKLIQWRWDGRNASVSEIVGKIQAGAVQTDNMDGTVTVTGAGALPRTVKELFPITAGVRVV